MTRTHSSTAGGPGAWRGALAGLLLLAPVAGQPGRTPPRPGGTGGAGRGPAPATAPAGTAAPWTITTLDGRTLKGRIQEMDRHKVVIDIHRGDKLALARRELEGIARRLPDGTLPKGPFLRLARGDLLPLEGVAPGAKGGLRVRFGGHPARQVSLEGIRAFRCRRSMAGEEVFLRDAMGPAPKGRDLLYLVRRKGIIKVAGAIGGLTRTHLAFEFAGQERSIPFDSIYGAVLAGPAGTGKGETIPPDRVELVEGGVLTGRVTAAGPDLIRLEQPVLGTLRLRWDRIAILECARDRLLDLTRVTPESNSSRPALDRKWPMRVDRTVDGNPLSIRGKVYSRGLSFLPARTITWLIPKGFDRFKATFGIADETRGKGAALFEVLVDGRSRFRRIIKGTDPPRRVAIDLAGARELTIKVDYGPWLHIGDHCILAEPRLVATREER